MGLTKTLKEIAMRESCRRSSLTKLQQSQEFQPELGVFYLSSVKQNGFAQ